MGRTSSHRAATMRNLASALFEHKQIRTTLAKAKAIQSYVDRLISYGRNDSVHSRRLAFKELQNRTLVKVLFDDIGPTYAERKSGFTRVLKLGNRRGDGAALALLQMVGFEPLKIESEPSPEKPQKAKKAKSDEPAVETKAPKKTAKKKADDVVEPAIAETAEAKPAKTETKAAKPKKPKAAAAGAKKPAPKKAKAADAGAEKPAPKKKKAAPKKKDD